MRFNKNNLAMEILACCLSQSGSRSLNGSINPLAKISLSDTVRNVLKMKNFASHPLGISRP